MIKGFVTSLVLLGSLALAAACSDDSPTALTSGPQPVIFDYSPTVSDVGALLYLSSHPNVDLLAVTLPGTGESDCEPGVRTTRFVLDLAGKPEVPVGCGRDKPLDGYRDWPTAWRAEANAIVDEVDSEFPEQSVVDAEQLLAETLESATTPVTVVAVGPLTNLGAVLSARPELAEKIARIVVMGGALDVPGNVEAAPTAEWNLYIDPESVRQTLASGVPMLFVGLDATNAAPWNRLLLARLRLLDTEVANFEDELVSSRPLEGVFLWDELAAVIMTDPAVVTTEETKVAIDDDGALLRDPTGVSVHVAVSADGTAATDGFLRVLAGGQLPKYDPLTADETAYVNALGAARASFDSALAEVFADSTEDAASVRTAPELTDIFFEAITDLEASVQAVGPPSTFADRQQALVTSLQAIAASAADVRTALGVPDDGDALDQFFASVDATGIAGMFEAFSDLVRDIEDESLVRGGPSIFAVTAATD